jgi:hypothetical protein
MSGTERDKGEFTMTSGSLRAPGQQHRFTAAPRSAISGSGGA